MVGKRKTTPELLVNMIADYISGDYNYCELGEKYDMSYSNVRHQLKKSNIPKNTNTRYKNGKEIPDIVGEKFNHLTVLKYEGDGNWLCECDCDNKGTKSVSTYSILHDKVKTCGNCPVKIGRRKCKSNSKTSYPEYDIWIMMKDRCYNQNNPRYADYGGRGIKVCDEWLYSFDNFIVDMTRRRFNGLSLDRINNDGDYCFENCRWATREEQDNNTSKNVFYTYDGQTLTLSQWAKLLNIKIETLHARKRYGWSTEKMLSKPVKPKKEKLNGES